MTDYEVKGDFIEVDALMSCIEDLLFTVGYLEEQVEDLEKDLHDNYIPIPTED
jgi:uncharacterized membrane protein